MATPRTRSVREVPAGSTGRTRVYVAFSSAVADGLVHVVRTWTRLFVSCFVPSASDSRAFAKHVTPAELLVPMRALAGVAGVSVAKLGRAIKRPHRAPRSTLQGSAGIVIVGEQADAA